MLRCVDTSQTKFMVVASQADNFPSKQGRFPREHGSLDYISRHASNFKVASLSSPTSSFYLLGPHLHYIPISQHKRARFGGYPHSVHLYLYCYGKTQLAELFARQPEIHLGPSSRWYLNIPSTYHPPSGTPTAHGISWTTYACSCCHTRSLLRLQLERSVDVHRGSEAAAEAPNMTKPNSKATPTTAQDKPKTRTTATQETNKL